MLSVQRIWSVIDKEWREVFKNKFVLFTVSFLPLTLTALPLGILYAMRGSSDFQGATMGDMPPQFAALCGGMSGMECLQYYIVTQFILLYMMVPLIVSITIASYSIVGEKKTRTLEPLLATPITTVELLLGKALAAAVPAVAATWVGFLLYAGGANLIVTSPVVLEKLVDPVWLTAVFVVGPLLAVAGVSIAVMISSRVNEPRAAEQISGVFVLPLLALFVGQTTGLVLINETFILWMAVGLFGLDSVLLYFATRLFERETILTRWK
jgi:ABC-2 type transport system permease protein